jgi:hypothetical protein
MGWWVGTVVYAGIYGIAAGAVHLTGRKGENGCAAVTDGRPMTTGFTVYMIFT